MEAVKDTLKERGGVYGDYKGGNHIRVEIMKLIQYRYQSIHREPMPLEQEYYIYDIVNKLSRLCVTPDHVDSWHDIGGYAKLIEDIFKEKQNEVQKPPSVD